MSDYPSSMPLFDRLHCNEPVRLNASVPDDERDRLGPQHKRILDRLKQGPVTNLELGQICQRFGARLDEMKTRFPWTRRQLRPGVHEYALKNGNMPERPVDNSTGAE